MMSTKEYTTEKAEEIAIDNYGKKFSDLTETQQNEIWKLAEFEWQDYYSTQIDAAYERINYGN